MTASFSRVLLLGGGRSRAPCLVPCARDGSECGRLTRGGSSGTVPVPSKYFEEPRFPANSHFYPCHKNSVPRRAAPWLVPREDPWSGSARSTVGRCAQHGCGLPATCVCCQAQRQHRTGSSFQSLGTSHPLGAWTWSRTSRRRSESCALSRGRREEHQGAWRGAAHLGRRLQARGRGGRVQPGRHLPATAQCLGSIAHRRCVPLSGAQG